MNLRVILQTILFSIVLFFAIRNAYFHYTLYNKFEKNWKEASMLVEELKVIYSDKGIELDLTYQSLIELEKEIEKELRVDCTDTYKEYLYDHYRHFIAYVGEVLLAENGGKWLIEKKQEGKTTYPMCIICKNGGSTSGFIVAINNAMEDLQDNIGSEFPLSYAYSTMSWECQNK
jgi:hypothetical protein